MSDDLSVASLALRGPHRGGHLRVTDTIEAPHAEARATLSISASLEAFSLRERIVQSARTWLGTPYLHQASLKHVGCDCLGLVRGVWREVYGLEPETPPPYSSDWAEASSMETMADAARRHCVEVPCTDYQTGDVLLFRWRDHLPAKHAGIATSKDSMIHAQDGVAVTEIHLSPWWKKRMAFAFRFPSLLPSPQGGGRDHAKSNSLQIAK